MAPRRSCRTTSWCSGWCEPEVTIGIGGNRTILAGDAQDYSIQLDNLGNVDAPYTYFQVGVPQLGTNYVVYELPYLTFSSNVRGSRAIWRSSANANVPYSSIAGSITDTNGQLITQGFLAQRGRGSSSGFTVQRADLSRGWKPERARVREVRS